MHQCNLPQFTQVLLREGISLDVLTNNATGEDRAEFLTYLYDDVGMNKFAAKSLIDKSVVQARNAAQRKSVCEKIKHFGITTLSTLIASSDKVTKLKQVLEQEYRHGQLFDECLKSVKRFLELDNWIVKR